MIPTIAIVNNDLTEKSTLFHTFQLEERCVLTRLRVCRVEEGSESMLACWVKALVDVDVKDDVDSNAFIANPGYKCWSNDDTLIKIKDEPCITTIR